ncbi:ABC transporter substrate-binding protein [Paenibacillus baekrokdamisoli]|uniref:ABC transporter substrate-binding protein n=1 Tax=Paenibacillus baekrokdamisoli TaxID=1712516 RepID=A0A3G9JAE7_9BACL|nr:extracellular solute-binding protein [Paenibacillus baekrokdamisoli]MBB3073450.1 raffinose/stachyose/melibiose transport system substrate-binding protein [Paenibacillus baekrokdamisoli]BBH20244.1 ABC transporter substrate-binding protein [Paenibacillus baekrokdamisoli]
MKKMSFLLLALLFVVVVVLSGCSSKDSKSKDGEKVTLTYWTQFTESLPESKWINAAVKRFEDSHPNVKVNVVHQTQDPSYFTMFQASSLSKTGPDIVDLWTGLYALRYKQFLEPLNKVLTDEQKGNLIGLQYASDGFDSTKSIYGIPSETQFYMGYYNKKLFEKAGIKDVPKTYEELLEVCKKLKDAGILPIADGGFNGSAYMPFQGFSYFMMNTLSVDDINKLRTGEIALTSQQMVEPLEKWAALYKNGYVNTDAMSTVNANKLFVEGKAAMVFNDGSWDIPQFQEALGVDNVGPFFPPVYNENAPSKGYTVAYPGVMTGVTNYSKHKELSLEFIKSALDPSVMGVMAQEGLVPALKGLSTDLMKNPLQLQLYKILQENKNWPMFDNLIQSEVMSTMTKEFQLVALDQVSPSDALKVIQQAWDSLPAGEKEK